MTAVLAHYAVLWAMGIARRRIVGAVLAQSAGVGGEGVLLGLPVVFLLAPGPSAPRSSCRAGCSG
jgi:hypothetical protein